MKTNKITSKTKAVIFMVLFTIFIAAAAGIPVFAEEDINEDTNSKGNILLDNGDMAFYSADIDYLETEKDNLFSELPISPDIEDIESFDFDRNRQANIRSKGRIDYAGGIVMIDASDLIYLAKEIDMLEAAYKMNTVAALNHMGTYYLEDGSVTHDKAEESLPVEYAVNLSFEEIYEGVLQSQSVEKLAITEEVVGASADNLTEGTAAWLDGELVVGNGADNDASYDQGYKSGYNAGYNAGRTQGQADVVANPSGYGISTGIVPEQFAMYSASRVFNPSTNNLTVPHSGTCYLKCETYLTYDSNSNANKCTITVLRNGTAIAYANIKDDGINISPDSDNRHQFSWSKTLAIPNCTAGESLELSIDHNGANISWIAGIY